MKFVVVLLSVAAVAYSSPVPQEKSVLESVIGNLVNCMNSDFNLCIKEGLDRATDRLRYVRSFDLSDGITFHNNVPREARSQEALSDDSQVRNRQLTERLWQKAMDMVQYGEVELSYGGEEGPRSLAEGEEARGKKKKGMKQKLKMLLPLLMMLKAKAGALALLFLGIMAVSLWKIAVIAKIAFIAKIAALIKMLLAKKHHGHEEHGWAPAEDHGHGWESQGWGRSKDLANDLAYAAHQKH